MALKKVITSNIEEKRAMIEPGHQDIPISRQCELIALSKAAYYYKPIDSAEGYNLLLMRLIDEQFIKTPFYGTRRMRAFLNRHGHKVNRKRVRRLMELMGLEAIYPKPNLSNGKKEHKKISLSPP